MSVKNVYFLAAWIFFIVRDPADCMNSPSILHVNSRNLEVLDTDVVGTRVTQVRSDGGDSLSFFLEHEGDGELPFRIDNSTGILYTNRTLSDLGGKTIRLYLGATDGHFPVKTEVQVHIVNTTDPQLSRRGSNNRRPPMFLPTGLYDYNNAYHPELFSKTSVQMTPATGPSNNSSSVTSVISVLSTTVSSSVSSIETKDYINPVVRNTTETVATHTTNLEITVIPVVTVLAVLILGCGFLWIFRRRLVQKPRKKGNKDDLHKDVSNCRAVIEEPIALQHWQGPLANSNRYEGWDVERAAQQVPGSPLTKVADRFEFPRHRLKVFNILGEGCFGQVWKCEALDIDGHTGPKVVAVKTLKENATEKERCDLIQELQVMKMLDPHPNVVRLLGCCTEKDPIFVIMEYVANGKLQSFLRNSRVERHYGNMHGASNNLTSKDLTTFVYEVAKGMQYLSSKGIIHRDLAARNILVSEDHVCKVADFGFARDVIANHVYERKSEGRLPIRWMAPESLYDNIFSSQSDVWSFGILMYEVVTLGSTPYPGLPAAEVMRRVKEGYRLDKPDHCRREIYNIMYYCWDKDPKERPTFSELITLLEKLLVSEVDYIELERFPDHSYYNMVSLSGEKL